METMPSRGENNRVLKKDILHYHISQRPLHLLRVPPLLFAGACAACISQAPFNRRGIPTLLQFLNSTL